MHNEEKNNVVLDELFSEQYPGELSEHIEDVEVGKPSETCTQLGEIDHNDIRLYDVDISLKGLKIGKIKTGKIFTVIMAVSTAAVLIGAVIMLV